MSRSLVPAADPWTLAVHRTDTGFLPVGTAVAIGPRQALTCAHVILDGFDDPDHRRVVEPLWVSFPKVISAWKQRRLVARVELDTDEPQVADVAVLHLVEDMPAGVKPARLRLLDPSVLKGRRWWAFGFPASSRRNGNEAAGTVGTRLAHGWVRLDTDSPYPVEKGFSGGGLWIPDYAAVAGIVGQAIPNGERRGDAQALTLAHADVFLPDAKLRVTAGWTAADAGPTAMAAWGWRLDEDPEAGRHWRPRGRGVISDLDSGYRFQGRRAALHRIVSWLGRPIPDRRVLVVTGSPGVGKSAVLGRIVTTADPQLRTELPIDDTGVRAAVDSVGCAVHVKGKTALEVATEIARAAGAALPAHAEELASAIHDLLASNPRRLNIVIDAVDEAASPPDARAVLTHVVLPLVQGCGHLGVQVVCGSRRHDSAGDVLRLLDGAALQIDLDDSAFFELEDLRAYTLNTLRLVGAERPGNPYADPAVAEPVARRIAALAEPNFLVAALEARRRGMYDETAADPATLALTATVDAALNAYLDRVPPVDGISARSVLAALAYARTPGWTRELWHTAATALGSPVTPDWLDRFARSAAAAFLVETSHADQEPTLRLFHQALNDALLRHRGFDGQRRDEQALTRALHAVGRAPGWQAAAPYLLRSLSGHADRAGLIDDLLGDDHYLLHADLLRLQPPASHARTPAGQARCRLLRLTPQAVAAAPDERAATFSVTQALEGLPPVALDHAAPYRARWARARPRTELRRLDGHTSAVNALCPIDVDGQTLLATASSDETVRLWNPATGTELRRLDGHTNWVNTICPIDVDGQALLATGSDDNTVRLWDPATGTEIRCLDGHTNWVAGVCPIDVNGHTLLATASHDNTVRLWDPATGTEIRRLDGHTNGVNTICPIDVNGKTLLATASHDNTVRLWNPATGTEIRRLDGHTNGVNTICPIDVNGQTLLATASHLRTVRLWDPATGTELRRLDGHTSAVNAVCTAVIDGQTLLATASNDRTVRLWDPATGTELRRLDGHTDWVNAVCTALIDGQTLLATASNDRTVRLWDPATGTELRRLDGHTDWVNAVCTALIDGQTLLATASNDRTVRLWDPATGTELRRLDGHTGWVNAVCTALVEGQTLLATASNYRTVRLWDPATGTELRRLDGHTGAVNALSPIDIDGQTLLATGSDDNTVRLWDPATGTELRRLDGHTGAVNALCPIDIDGQTLLASASSDETVRLWNPATRGCTSVIATHHPALACASIDDLLAVALTTGLLTIDILASASSLTGNVSVGSFD